MDTSSSPSPALTIFFFCSISSPWLLSFRWIWPSIIFSVYLFDCRCSSFSFWSAFLFDACQLAKLAVPYPKREDRDVCMVVDQQKSCLRLPIPTYPIWLFTPNIKYVSQPIYSNPDLTSLKFSILSCLAHQTRLHVSDQRLSKEEHGDIKWALRLQIV